MSPLSLVAEVAHPHVSHVYTSVSATTPITANQLLPGWMRRRRKSLNLTQADLAGRLSCSLSTVQKLEEGERRPSKALATNLLEALEIPEGEHAVFMRLARGKPAPRSAKPEASRDEAALRPTGLAEDPPPNNTPFPSNALFGREVESHWVQDLLAGDDARLITLTGLPGVGKTRLAQHIAHAAQFKDGVGYVSLAATQPEADPQQRVLAVTTAIAKSLRIEQDTPDQVIAYLRERRVLLVLDDVVPHDVPHRASEAFLLRLLTETRWVKLLITTHQRLRLRAEHVVQLAGLPIGEASPALQLFLAHASRVAGPAFAHLRSAPNAMQNILRICQLVDGLPLAIEMASELTARHSLDDIGAAIERDLNVLQTAAPDVPAAHRNLHTLFASLWQRLSPAEQRMVAQCAALPVGFAVEDVSRVSQPEEGSVQSLLDGLIEKGIVRRLSDNDRLLQKGLYLLHPLLRQYVAQSQQLKTYTNPNRQTS